MKTAFSTTTLALCALAASSLSHAQTAPAQALYNRSLAATCANCHGTDGISAGGNFTSLAGRRKKTMLDALRECVGDCAAHEFGQVRGEEG